MQERCESRMEGARGGKTIGMRKEGEKTRPTERAGAKGARRTCSKGWTGWKNLDGKEGGEKPRSRCDKSTTSAECARA
eukprot:scaffold2858_cov659-Pavlova_lutheri.AAC.120